MPGPDPKPEDEGPIYRDALRRADAVDRAQTPGERRRAAAKLAPSGLAMILEGLLRDSFRYGAILFSIIVAVLGATSGKPAWIVAGIASGVLGAGLVVLSLVRRWSFGRQWVVLGGVVIVQVAFMIFFWKIDN